MPILEIEVVTRFGEKVPDSAAADLADALGAVFEAPGGRLWVRLRELPEHRYAENGQGGGHPHPVFVTLRLASVPAAAELASLLTRIAACVGPIVDRPREDVHIIVEPAMKGRIAFGGKLVA